MPLTKVSDLAEINKKTWSPSSSEDSQVLHFSIPNYDLGEAFLEDSSTLKSNKNLISDPCVLVSKLNPSTPRIWLIESAPTHTAVSSTEFIALRPKDPSDLLALYFALKSPRAVSRISEQATGTSNSHQRVRPQDILDLDLELAVDRIGLDLATNFLWSLERKIALNKRISETLESIAQALFRSRFVDFDPVRAKMAGEKPAGMDDATAALFPDSMEESELGEIPAGWEVAPTSELFDVGIGRTPPRKEPQWFVNGGKGVPWVSIRDMGTYSTYSGSTSEDLTHEAVEKHRVSRVPAGTVLMSFKLTVGKLCIASTELTTNEAIAHFKIANHSPLDSIYTFLWLRNFDFKSLDSTSSIATATNSKVVKQIKFLVPSHEVLEHFTKIVEPLFLQLKTLQEQSDSLVEIRDTLLPRLISGELQIPEDMVA